MDTIHVAGVELNDKQVDALHDLYRVLVKATETELFDALAANINPDIINQFCDEIEDVERETQALSEGSSLTRDISI